MTAPYEADVARLHNEGMGRIAIAKALELTIGQINGALYRAGPKGLLRRYRLSANGCHLGEPGDGAAAIEKARKREPKTTPARDAAIKRLYSTERDDAVILEAVNALPGGKMTWPDISRRASELQARRYKEVSRPPPPPPRPRRAHPREEEILQPPSARAALRGMVSMPSIGRCCFPSWPQHGRPADRSSPRYCDAPAVEIHRADGSVKPMPYCFVHCAVAYPHFSHPAIWGGFSTAFPGYEGATARLTAGG